MFYSEILLRTIAWEDSLSDSSDELFQRDEREARIYRSFTGKNVVEHQKIIDNHTKNPSSQGNDFTAFLCMGMCKSLAS